MKKLFIILTGLFLMIGISSCINDTKKPLGTTTVENLISLDRETMRLNYSNNYRWYETNVQLKNYLDEENDGTFELVINVFQVIEVIDDHSADTFVFKFKHINGETIKEQEHGFWIEDSPLNSEPIKVSFAEAYEKVMAVNLPKPHSRQVVLRKQIGPVSANAQWIFGNMRRKYALTNLCRCGYWRSFG